MNSNIGAERKAMGIPTYLQHGKPFDTRKCTQLDQVGGAR